MAFQSITEKPARSTTATTGDDFADKSRSQATRPSIKPRLPKNNEDEWGDGGIDDQEFVYVAEDDSGYVDIDDLENSVDLRDAGKHASTQHEDAGEPEQMENGKWPCNHACKDKSKCKHLCCREGLDKKPKARKAKSVNTNLTEKSTSQSSKVQSKLALEPRRKGMDAPSKKDRPEHIDMSIDQPSARVRSTTAHSGNKLPKSLHEHPGSSRHVLSIRGQEASYSYLDGKAPRLGFLEAPNDDLDAYFTEEILEDSLMDDLPELCALPHDKRVTRKEPDKTLVRDDTDKDEDFWFECDDQEMLDAALIGAEDSHLLRSQGDKVETTATGQANISPQPVSSPRRHEPVMEQSSETGLFVPLGCELSTYSAGVLTDLGPGIETQKRKADIDDMYEGLESSNLPNKRSRTGASTTCREEEDMDDILPEAAVRGHDSSDMSNHTLNMEPVPPTGSKASPRTPELRAWLAAEFGDCVELVDFME